MGANLCHAQPDPTEAAKLAKIKTQPRRPGYAAEAVSLERLSGWKPPVYAKDETTKQEIKRLVRGNAKLQILFGAMDEAQLEAAVLAMSSRLVTQGETVIRQGDSGDAFYVVETGLFEIFVQRGDRAAGKVAEAGPGSFFGEAALMWNAPRAATVVCASLEGRLWALDSASFQLLMASAGVNRKREVESFLEKIPILAELNRYELGQLSQILVEETFRAKDVITKQGDLGDKFFILLGGAASVYIDGPEGTFKVKTYATPGDYFGELALLSDQCVRAASVIAEEADGCKVLTIRKDDFTRVLGPITDTLQRNAANYPQYSAFLKGHSLV